MSWIVTHSGAEQEIEDPCTDKISLAEVAHALSHICRFGGHTRRFYSVAAHSVFVSRLAEALDPTAAFAGLMHDAPEAYIGDLVSPIKRQVPAFRALEKKWAIAVGNAFGVDLVELPEAVKLADTVALIFEREALLPPSPRPWLEDATAGHDFKALYEAAKYVWELPRSPADARRSFTERFRALQTFRALQKGEQ